MEKGTINQKEFSKFWDWIGVSLKKIRYQKYLLWLFENGYESNSPLARCLIFFSYLPGFITGMEAEDQLKNETPGTFLIRLSERLDGEFVISYAHQSGVRHYLIQPDDTADKKKTLIDFLGQNPLFSYILQVATQPTGKRVYYKHSKDKVLQRYQPGNFPGNNSYNSPLGTTKKHRSKQNIPQTLGIIHTIHDFQTQVSDENFRDFISSTQTVSSHVEPPLVSSPRL